MTKLFVAEKKAKVADEKREIMHFPKGLAKNKRVVSNSGRAKMSDGDKDIQNTQNCHRTGL